MPKFPKYAWGDLNPLTQKKFGPRFDPQESNFETAEKTLLNQHYTTDSISKRTEFVGIVLRVEGNTAEPNSFVDTSESPETVGATSRRLRLKVRIPEIHASIPEPADYKDHFIIDMHPTFTGINNRLPTPRIGDRVLVSFNDPENMVDPMYKEYLEDTRNLRIGKGKKSSRNCLEYAPGKGCLEPRAGSSAKLDVKLFPAPKGSLVPKRTNSTVVMFGDSQMAGNFGKTYENYLKVNGWATKRKGVSSSATRHWLIPGKDSSKPANFKLNGFLQELLSINPELTIISLAGNDNYGSAAAPGTPEHESWKKKFAARVKNIAEQCLKNCKMVLWYGAPPTVKNSKTGYASPRHNWYDDGAFKYREVVNLIIEKVLKETFSDQYNKQLYFINPIGSKAESPPYASKEKYLKEYASPGGDGIHLTKTAAAEYVRSIAAKDVYGEELKKAAVPPHGASAPAPPAQTLDPAMALYQSKKELTTEKNKPLAEQDKDLIKKLEADIKKYEAMPKALTAEQKEKFVEKYNKLVGELQQKQGELAQAQQSGGNTAALEIEIDQLRSELEVVEEMLDEDDAASKPDPCDPCNPNDINIKNKWETEPLALNWEEAKKPEHANATKYIRAFLRMIIIGEGGRKSHSGISPYQLVVGGNFVRQRPPGGGQGGITDPASATRLGPKSPVGNSFLDYAKGHPRLLIQWSTRFPQGSAKNNSTAAGRYQFMENTWYNDMGKKFGSQDTQDFSPVNQDRVVADFLAKKGIKEMLEEGGDNFVTPQYDGSRDINKGLDTRPPTKASIASVGAKPANIFEQKFFESVSKIRKVWASLPGAGYAGQQTSKKATVFLDYYKFALAQEIEAEAAGTPET